MPDVTVSYSYIGKRVLESRDSDIHKIRYCAIVLTVFQTSWPLFLCKPSECDWRVVNKRLWYIFLNNCRNHVERSSGINGRGASLLWRIAPQVHYRIGWQTRSVLWRRHHGSYVSQKCLACFSFLRTWEISLNIALFSFFFKICACRVSIGR